MKPEAGQAETKVQSRVQDRGDLACQGTRGIGSGGRPRPGRPREYAAQVGEGVRCRPFPGHRQMKPEQQEIERLRREVTKLKAERDIPKKGPQPKEAT